jgi:acetyl esterase/lipase
MTARFILLIWGFAVVCFLGVFQSDHLGADDIVRLPSTPANERMHYGAAPSQFADLRLPLGPGPFPVVVVIHGGCWAEFADLSIMANFATTLTKAGVATWNLEYRRVHEEGGGWPGTFQDAGAGIDYLRVAARSHPLDLQRVVTVGHSAGGQLALWAAARSKLPKNSPLYVADPLRIRGAVSLAGIADMESYAERSKIDCRDRMVQVLGGLPAAVPSRYQQVSPRDFLPLGVPQRLFWGANDHTVPQEFFLAYENDAQKKGDDVQTMVFDNSNHFDMLSTQTSTWSAVQKAIVALLGK